MSATAVRAALRPTRVAIRQAPSRNASTTSEVANTASATASKAKESTSQATSKASEGLTRVTESGGSAMSKGGAALSGAVNNVGGRAGRLVSAVQSLIPPMVHYSKVGWEVSKIVFRGQQMSPPSIAQVQTYFQPLVNGVRNPSSLFAKNPGLLQPQPYINMIRNVSRQQLVTVGIVFAEVVGFFTVGEMVGKAKIVGYRHDGVAADHH